MRRATACLKHSVTFSFKAVTACMFTSGNRFKILFEILNILTNTVMGCLAECIYGLCISRHSTLHLYCQNVYFDLFLEAELEKTNNLVGE